MSDVFDIYTLPDRAIVLYIALKDGATTISDLRRKLHKSPASIYRAIDDLAKAGLIQSMRTRPIRLPETEYKLVTKLQNAA